MIVLLYFIHVNKKLPYKVKKLLFGVDNYDMGYIINSWITIQGNSREKGDENLFSNLNAEMARNKLTIKSLAEKTGINYESLKNKMSGITEFKRSEMISIKKEFPNCSLDYLFSTE